jgi:type III secretion protein Q
VVLSLEKLSGADVACLNVLCSRDRSLQLALGEKRFDVALPPARAAFSPRFRVVCAIDGRKVTLGFDRFLLEEYLAARFPGQDFTALPEVLQPVVLEAAVEDVLAKAEASTGRRIAVESCGPWPPAEPPRRHLSFDLLESGTGRRIGGCVELEGEALRVLAELLEPLPVAQRDLDWLPVYARVEVGAARVVASEVASARPGDLILLDSVPGQGDNGVVVRLAGSIRCAARLEAGRVTILTMADEGMPEPDQDLEEDDFEEADEAETAEPILVSVDELPVDLRFELGEARLTVGELRTMAAGFTFDLGKDFRAPVGIRANGRVIGSGELVEIDGRVGVRVAELFGSADAGDT